MMDCSVRFVCETRLNSSGRQEQLGGLKPALCVRGEKVALAVINDELWVRTIEMDLPSHDKSSFVTYHGAPYEPKPFADRLLMSAKLASKPMTRRAKHILTMLGTTVESELPQELLERELLEQERVYADNTPKERQKDAQRPSKVKDVTKEYTGRLYPVKNELQPPTEIAEQVISSISTEVKKAPKKVPKKIPPVLKRPIAAIKGAKAPLERGTLIKRLAAEHGLTTFELRVMIRTTGMRAPYEDEKAVRAAIKKGQKLVAGNKK